MAKTQLKEKLSGDKNEVLYCYLRVSTQKQIEDGSSIDLQRDTGRRVAEKLNMKYVELDEGGRTSKTHHMITGKISLRPVYEELKQGIRDGRIKNIWVYDRTRWNRDMLENLAVKQHYLIPFKIKMYEGENAKLRNFFDENETLTDTIVSAVGEQARDKFRNLSISGKRYVSMAEGKNGAFMGGTINYGYKNVDKKWKRDKDEAEIVKDVFNMYLNGTPLKNIKIHLDTQGIKPRRAKLWAIGTLHKMLMNSTYTGEYIWTDKDSEESFTITVPKIITHSVFNRVQEKLQKNRKHVGNNTRKSFSLLSDFLTCYCGQKITGNIRKTVGRKVYECSSRHNYWKGKLVEECNNRRSMNMDATDNFVIGSIKSIMSNSSTIKDAFKREVMEKKSMDTQQIDFEKELREKKIERLDYQLENSTKAIATNKVNHMLEKTSDDLFNEVEKQLKEQRLLIENERTQNIGEINDLDNRKEWIDWITLHGEKIEQDFDNWEDNISTTAEMLRGMITSIKVHPVEGLNRDKIEKQLGHKLVINFKQAIVNDGIKYNDENDKSKGYTLTTGKKSLDMGEIKILTGGRGKKQIKQINALMKNYDTAKKKRGS